MYLIALLWLLWFWGGYFVLGADSAKMPSWFNLVKPWGVLIWLILTTFMFVHSPNVLIQGSNPLGIGME